MADLDYDLSGIGFKRVGSNTLENSLMVRSALAFSLMVTIAPANSIILAQDSQVEAGFIQIFDGKSFAGWEGDMKWFRIEDGSIIAGDLDVEKIPNNFFLATEKTYTDFELRLDAKLYGEGKNAGVQIRTKRIPNHHEVSGYQADMGNAWKRPVWGSLYDESRRRKMLAEPDADAVTKILKMNDWNQFRIRCEGPKVEIWLNDFKTVDYIEEDDSIDRSGIIALQIHGGKPAEAAYRNIRIKILD